MIVKSWAAKWLDLDTIAIAMWTHEGIKQNWKIGRGIAERLAFDFGRTVNDGDDSHIIRHDQLEQPIIIPRDEVAGLRQALISLLERGIIGSPFVGHFSPSLRLVKSAGVQVISPQTTRWV